MVAYTTMLSMENRIYLFSGCKTITLLFLNTDRLTTLAILLSNNTQCLSFNNLYIRISDSLASVICETEKRRYQQK